MFKRFLNLFQLDVKSVIRGKFHYAVLFLAALAIAVINFAIPAQVKITPKELLVDLSQGKVMENYLIESGADKSRFYGSMAELKNALENDKNTIGIAMEGTLDKPCFNIIQQGSESAEIINVLSATVEQMVSDMKGSAGQSAYEVRYLREKSSPMPFNKNMVPVMVVFEVVMFGFIVIAVMVFQEKDQGSIRAFRVTPAGTLEYILSKTLVNVLLALVYGGLIVLFTTGFSGNISVVLLLIVLTSFLMTIVGLLVSVFFNSISEFIFPGLMFLFIFAAPMVSYMFPSFAPEFIKFIPSYPVAFGIREALFPTGKQGYIGPIIITLVIEGIAFLALSYFAVRKKLMKEGR